MEKKCEWTIEPDSKTGWKLIAKGPGCKIQADKASQNLGPIARKVLNRRIELKEE